MNHYRNVGRLNASELNDIGGVLLGNPETLMLTATIADEVVTKNIPGDMAECGVFAGSHPAVMALTLQKVKDDTRKVHLFDSFAGIPKGGVYDSPDITNLVGIADHPTKPEPSGKSVCPIEYVQEMMARWRVDPSRLVYHQGWFQDTMRPAFESLIYPEGPGLSILRIDGDLYESVKTCLMYLYPCLNAGGFLILDDYALTGARTAIDEYLGSVYMEPPKFAYTEQIAWFQKPPAMA